jgi:glutaminyl-tRNA synthetase
MSRCRNEKIDSPWRNTSIEENLALFKKMRSGFYAEGECSLRAKMDMQHPNTTMRDLVIYRVRYVPHPHSGDKWCIYPTYDFTHCLVDSLENVTHSCCTLEFEIRRECYYWFLKVLDMYKPYVWEFGRLNMSNTVLSKRKIEKLINEKYVTGWDDPRLHTIQGLRRRGYTPSMINNFCGAIGVSRKGNENIVDYKKLEFFARKELDATAPRSFGVTDPVLLEITNLSNPGEKISAPLFPAEPEKGSQTYTLTKNVYIENDDFSADEKSGFFGVMPGQVVCLRYGPFIRMIEVVRGADGKVQKVFVE